METATLKRFAQGARRQLLEQVSARMEQVLRSDSVEIREKAKVVEELRGQIDALGKQAVVDKVAYTWFNRFCALRFMDVNHYTRIGAVSPAEGFVQPEVLQEAKNGHIDEELAAYVNTTVVFGLLSNQRPASNPQGEAYRLLLVGICNYFNAIMPFLFEKIEDFTELLMPLDLLSENSVLHDLREVLTPEACQDVDVIGWLYQYYISERKDQVFEALKKNQKIEAEDIPAATQLFTPHWIVRYLVENSLGRLWILNHPNSRLKQRMEYYIPLTQNESKFLRISSPEEIKICDPACGSGHMLTYAFELLFAIYEEQGYNSAEIPSLILRHNLCGIEIDKRAGDLAAFALVMKARSSDRRFFSRGVLPNICVLENVTFNEQELRQYINAVGSDLFTEPLRETLLQFEQASNFGSLIRPILTDAAYIYSLLKGKNLGGDLFLYGVHERVLKVLKFAEFLAPRYHVVTTNPPYMGSKGMNEALGDFAKDNYSVSKTDAFAMFIERSLDLIVDHGNVGMITIPGWMFLSSFEKLRHRLFEEMVITSLVHNGRGIWGPDFGSCSFVLEKSNKQLYSGTYIRLFRRQGEVNSNETLRERFQSRNNLNTFFASADDFKKIPGSPIAYWINDRVREVFSENKLLGQIADVKQGLATAENDSFLRLWYEVCQSNVMFNAKNAEAASSSNRKWFPHSKGGNFRRWYGNMDYLVNWKGNGVDLKSFSRAVIRNEDFYFRECVTWTLLSISTTSFRFTTAGNIIGHKGPGIFINSHLELLSILGQLNSNATMVFLGILAPTLGFEVGQVSLLPVAQEKDKCVEIVASCIKTAKMDWDSYEISWDFTKSPLLYQEHHQTSKLDTIYVSLRQTWRDMTLEMQFLEQENNRIFIDAYGLQDELTSDVPLEAITLTCNPRYRWGGNRSEEELEVLLLADTMKEFISYAVGCIFGRYSLNKPGLVLANQGETLKDYLKQIPKPTFIPDEDNAIPVLEGEWFSDDIAERFKKLLRVTFGDEHYEENLAFLEEALGRDVRSYFVKEFYKDHVQMYRKRPIYWMFSSPKGSFNVLIYMHRYQPDTVSIVLNNYLREYIKKLNAHKSQLERTSVSGSASQGQKTKALKEITQVNKILAELKDYEDDVLYPLATQRIAIDLDDGVKVNYGKFGSALAKIAGL